VVAVKSFFCKVGQSADDSDFSWVIKTLGSAVSITKVEACASGCASCDYDDGTDDACFTVFHSGPAAALYVTRGGFVYEEDGDAIPWEGK
jgi:hypothetical protein